VRRATTSPSKDEAGFTLVEILVTAAVMSIVATAIMGFAIRVFTSTATIVDRRDVFAEGRIALDRMSKQIRQGESVTNGTASQIEFESYLDGDPTSFAWRVTGSAAPYKLQESRDGGSTFVTVATSLTSNSVFTYPDTDQVRINLSLGTDTSTVDLTADVYLRNAST
jgi:prepilin-type N-terminal cleavage/methylation domain-containing protein